MWCFCICNNNLKGIQFLKIIIFSAYFLNALKSSKQKKNFHSNIIITATTQPAKSSWKSAKNIRAMLMLFFWLSIAICQLGKAYLGAYNWLADVSSFGDSAVGALNNRVWNNNGNSLWLRYIVLCFLKPETMLIPSTVLFLRYFEPW